MVIAGDASFGGIIDDVELVSLDPEYPVPSCLSNLNKFPVRTRGAAGSVGEGMNCMPDDIDMNLTNFPTCLDGLPFVCGGRTEPGYSDLCYKYSPLHDTWQQHGTMPSERADRFVLALIVNHTVNMILGYLSNAAPQHKWTALAWSWSEGTTPLRWTLSWRRGTG